MESEELKKGDLVRRSFIDEFSNSKWFKPDLIGRILDDNKPDQWHVWIDGLDGDAWWKKESCTQVPVDPIDGTVIEIPAHAGDSNKEHGVISMGEGTVDTAAIARNIAREGDKLILPESATIPEVIEMLKAKMQEEEADVQCLEEIDAYPDDAANALMLALSDLFGTVSPQDTMTMFGPKPPQTRMISVGVGVTTPVVWGQMQIPGMSGYIETRAHQKSDGNLIFLLNAVTKKKFEPKFRKIAQKVREILKEKSIYKGKAIMLRTDEDGDLDHDIPPQFLNLSNASMAELVFSEDTMRQVQVNLFTLIERTEKCREERIPLKRGILLEGPYGTGKTLTAFATAKKCTDNGWTFIYLDRVQGLREAYRFASRYTPAVIFAEDIDRALEMNRDTSVDDILNSADGIDSKSREVITILTTNNVERIEKAMMRPGRLDAVIHIGPPDARAAMNLIKTYGKGILAEGADFSLAAEALAGRIPAVIREIIEKAKLYCVTRSNGHRSLVEPDDLLMAVKDMTHHLKLMEGTHEAKKSPEEMLGVSMAEILERNGKDTATKVAEMHERVCN